jgi:hypothetical protein
MYGSAPSYVVFRQWADQISRCMLLWGAMSKRHNAIHHDTMDHVLDKVSYMREELLAIERSLERMQAVKPEREKDRLKNSSRRKE